MIAARGVHHLAIQVRDLVEVERFYAETLGLTVLQRWPAASGGGERSVWLDTGGGAGPGAFLALEVVAGGATAAEDDERGGRPGLHLIALRITAGERASWETRLAAAGVEIYHRTRFTLYVRDPEGNRVGLSHFPDGAVEPGPGRGG